MPSVLRLVLPLLLLSSLFADTNTTLLPIYITGNKIIKSEKLYKAAGVKEKSFFEFYKSDVKKVPIERIDKLHALLKAYYQTQGFFSSSVRVKRHDANVTVEINENTFVKVSEVNLSSDFGLKKLKIFKKGERFNPEKFSQLKTDIQKALLAKGYCNYHFDNKAYVDLVAKTAMLSYTIEKRKRCTFGKISVNGLQTIEKPIVTSRLNIQEGDNFNTQDIADIYTNLQKLQAFDSIVVNYSDKNNSVVPIDITLKEKAKTLHYKLGLGYDTNLGLRTSALLERFNYLSNAKKLTMMLELSTKLYTLESALAMPSIHTFGYYFDYVASLGYKVDKSYSSFDINTLYGGMKLKKEVGYLNYAFGLGYERSNYTSKSGEALLLDEDNLFLLYPYIQLIYDRRDSKLNPKNGYYLLGYLEYGFPYNDVARSYAKVMLEGRYIKSIEELTLSSVLKLGMIHEIQNETPQTKMFFGGGSFSNRAYGYNEIGVITSPTTDSALGGLSMANLSLEANYPIYDALSGAIFSDISMISDQESDFGGEHITTLGMGVRYLTPIGPFKIDAGVNVEDKDQYGIIFQLGQSF